MKTSELSRRQFLKQLGMMSDALISFYCLDTALMFCSKDSGTPTPTTTPGETIGVLLELPKELPLIS